MVVAAEMEGVVAVEAEPEAVVGAEAEAELAEAMEGPVGPEVEGEGQGDWEVRAPQTADAADEPDIVPQLWPENMFHCNGVQDGQGLSCCFRQCIWFLYFCRKLERGIMIHVKKLACLKNCKCISKWVNYCRFFLL